MGLTGGIGAGKSEALAALARLGAETLSTDDVVHELYAEPELRDLVTERWGPEVAPEGVVDRAAVARYAFADPQERSWLESVLWPRVAERVAQARAKAKTTLVVETPLLFEAGMESAYDATIAVIAPEEVRRRRAAVRGHEAVDERTARQLTQEEKAARATYVVVNDGTLAELEAKLSAILAKLNDP